MGARSRRLTALGLTAVAAFPLFDDGYAKTVRVDLALRAELPAARAALQAPASSRCVQPVLFPQIGYPERINPLFDISCLDEPGAIALGVDPYSLTDQAMRRAVDGWRAAGRARDLGAGFVFIGPPSAPEAAVRGDTRTPPRLLRRGRRSCPP